jgi:nucleoside-diphosphate-sugar epimerase
MATALIGHTGFVGRTLLRQTAFDEVYNSTNITAIRGRSYELIVCAGAPAAKWKANQEPKADLANLESLMSSLSEVAAERFVLISTVDVYPTPRAVDEASPVDAAQAEPYGRHRFQLEEFARRRFPQASVVRLPGLFGAGLKKNFVYDLLYGNCLHLTHAESVFQFYDLSRLWADLQVVMRRSLPLVNFAVEPVRARDVAERCFGISFDNITERPPASYDLRTCFAHFFGGEGKYFYSAQETFARIKRFAEAERKAAAA